MGYDVDAVAAKLLEDAGKIMVYEGHPVAIPKAMPYVEIGPASVILELFRTP